MAKKSWLKGVGCLYRPTESRDEAPEAMRVVLGGRTWVIKPNDDSEIDAPRAEEERR
jgi:hypothetical protein